MPTRRPTPRLGLGRGDRLPRIAVPPPGPASRALARRLRRSEAPGVNTLYRDQPSLAWERARGANVLDVDGNRFIDLTAGFGVAAVGHGHPAVLSALRAQAARLLHGLGDVQSHRPRVELAEALCRLAPVDRAQVHFALSGSEAVEVALKTALLSTGRPGILAFTGAYHGLTFGALAATSRDSFRAPFLAHLTPHVARAPFGAPIEELDAAFSKGAIGTVLVEPILGREGIVLPPEGWLRALAELARRRGALFIADEIFTGFGRSGRLFAVEHDGVRPDLLCCGKALGGGLPIAAVIGRRELLARWATPGEALHTATFVAHPTACAAALAVLDVLRTERLSQRAARLGKFVERRLAPLRACAGVRALRGRGLLWAIELTDAALAGEVQSRALGAGVILLAGGPEGRVLQIAPPLVITERQLAAALDILGEAIAECVPN
jgi:4-aminobutyrate aminotransferase-like enzyme